ncbi:MAG: FxsA family protein [Porticoccaceae bacterium]
MRVLYWLVVAVPLLDLCLLIRVGQAIGSGRTIVLMLLIAALGLAVVRRQGFAALLRARERLAIGEPPSREMLDAAVLTVAGLLLLIPGFLTDVMALVGLLPPLRRWLAKRLLAGSLVFTGSPSGVARAPGNIIEGEYRREDEPPSP